MSTLEFGLAGLKVSVHNRAYADAVDYWDGNWINVSARCESVGVHSFANGAILHGDPSAGASSKAAE